MKFPPMRFLGTFSISFCIICRTYSANKSACYEFIECLACNPIYWSWTISVCERAVERDAKVNCIVFIVVASCSF